ncbi:MAG: hypothetical protein ACRCTZ_09425 [Sarcina sp.]
MSKLKAMGIFLGGAVVGGLISAHLVKNKYEEIIDAEIQSVKDAYKNRIGIDEDFIARKEYRESDLMENCDIEQIATTDDIKAYIEKKNNKVKTDYCKYGKKTKSEETPDTNDKIITPEFQNYNDVVEEKVDDNTIPPTLIDEEDAGQHGFDMQKLIYHSDGVLVTEDDEVLDIDTYVGNDNITLFEENPGCMTMFVRNENTYLDYEIQRDDVAWYDLDPNNQ